MVKVENKPDDRYSSGIESCVNSVMPLDQFRIIKDLMPAALFIRNIEPVYERPIISIFPGAKKIDVNYPEF